MHKTRVGVLRGGPSSEYEISLLSGGAVLSALREKLAHLYHPVDILIDRNGEWHIDGFLLAPEIALQRIDVIFNALHGSYGEDGKVQGFLEAHGMPFTGSGALASAIGMNKMMTNEVVAKHGVKIPLTKEIISAHILKDLHDIAQKIFNSFPMPAVVKPVSAGSSVGVFIVRTLNDLTHALESAAAHGPSVMIQEFISGTETTCGVIEHFRDQELYALPPIEIRSETEFFDYDAKYKGKSKEIVPATFSDEYKKKIETLSRDIHKALGLKHYSRSDFIIHPRRGIYFLEVNTLPGLTEESLIPKALRSVGSDLHHLIDHLIGLSLKKKY